MLSAILNPLIFTIGLASSVVGGALVWAAGAGATGIAEVGVGAAAKVAKILPPAVCGICAAGAVVQVVGVCASSEFELAGVYAGYEVWDFCMEKTRDVWIDGLLIPEYRYYWKRGPEWDERQNDVKNKTE